MAIGVRIGEFHLNRNSSWEDYVERIELCCAASKLTEDPEKRAALLSCCGEETYSLIATLVKPLRPPNADYHSIVEAVKNHINPKPSELYSRYVFSKRDQHDGESVADYVTALRKLSENCGFSDKQLPLDIMLRDRLVFGISDSTVQQRLLAEKNLTFATAYDLAVTAESAAKHQRAIGSQRHESPDITAKVDTQRLKKGQDEKVSSAQSERRCFRCLGNHAGYRCKFKNAVCLNCSGKGHIAKACRKKKGGQLNHQLEGIASSAQTEYDDLRSISQVTTGCPKFMVTVSIGGETVPMEVDSGAARSIISEKLFKKLKVATSVQLEEADTQLLTWTKEGLHVIGKAIVPVKFKEQDFKLPLLVVRNDGSTLLGRDWFKDLNISITGLHTISQSAEAVTEKFPDVFGETFPGAAIPPVHIELKHDAQPKFLKCRSIPFALKDDVINELDKLERQGVLQPTQYAEWATPVVIVRKKNGSLRICGDYRSTVNQAVRNNVYPLPTSKELFARLGRGRIFSKIDLTQAYQQLSVDDSSADVLTINTVKGLYRVRRLPFGVSVAPGLFQRTMDTLLAGLPQVAAYLDDILVASETVEEHHKVLMEVFDRLSKAQLRVQGAKCQFFKESLEYLGHRIDGRGIYPSKSKVDAIHEAPTPQNKKELQAFLGMVNFYNSFLRAVLKSLKCYTAYWTVTVSGSGVQSSSKLSKD